jgi:hypothetical protein
LSPKSKSEPTPAKRARTGDQPAAASRPLHPILQLQRTGGNHAVRQLLQSLPLLGPNDPVERAAEESARRAGRKSYGPVKDRFDKMIAAGKIKPPTWYAASNQKEEFFAESFALFYSDPAWLRQNWPDLYNFMADVDKNGPK